MRTKLITLKLYKNWQGELKRFIRFGAVGASSTLLDFAILAALKFFLSWPTLPANLVSYSSGTINSYILTRLWVYPENESRQRLVQLAQFVLVSLTGLIFNNLLVLALEHPVALLIGNQAYSYLPAKLIATFVVLLWNFFANRFWTFGNGKTRDSFEVVRS